MNVYIIYAYKSLERQRKSRILRNQTHRNITSCTAFFFNLLINNSLFSKFIYLPRLYQTQLYHYFKVYINVYFWHINYIIYILHKQYNKISKLANNNGAIPLAIGVQFFVLFVCLCV